MNILPIPIRSHHFQTVLLFSFPWGTGHGDLKTGGCKRLCISSFQLLLPQIYWNERQLRDTGICSSHSTCWSQIYQEKQPPIDMQHLNDVQTQLVVMTELVKPVKRSSQSCQPFDAHCFHIGTAMKHPVPDRVKQSFVIFDIRALWRSGLSVRVLRCQKLQMTAWLNPVWHSILYSCGNMATHMATVGVKGLINTDDSTKHRLNVEHSAVRVSPMNEAHLLSQWHTSSNIATDEAANILKPWKTAQTWWR